MPEPSTPRRFTNIHVAQIIRYRLPAAGMVSILHRISGAMMFLLLPFILYLFDLSITSEISFAALQGFASHWFVKLLILAISWGYLHHFCGGIRHLIMDARKSARMVFAFSLPLTFVVALKLYGVI
jgi:succinate dehydrogenase / fumarate reductase cytochrome b subunit